MIYRSRHLCCSLVVVFAACASVRDMSGLEVSATIARLWREHIDAAKRKDAAAVVTIYADDILYRVPGEEVRGRAAIAAMEARTLAEADVIDAQHTTTSLRIFGDIAYELGTVVGPIRAGGDPPRTVTFHFMALWKRGADNAWRIQSFVGAPD